MLTLNATALVLNFADRPRKLKYISTPFYIYISRKGLGSSHNATLFAQLHIKKARFSAHQYFDFFLNSYDFDTSFFLSGIIRFDRYPSVYPFGESIVSFECEDIWFSSERENKNASLEIQLQRHANDNWTTVVESNRSSVFWKSENTLFRFTILSVRVRERQYNQRVTLKGLIQSKQCTVDPKISPDLRCVLSDESGIIDSSSETRILSIEGIW